MAESSFFQVAFEEAQNLLQRGYTVGQMRTLVEQAGLKILEIMDSDTGEAVTETSERVYIVAKEQQKEL